jgi:hypothetical protein
MPPLKQPKSARTSSPILTQSLLLGILITHVLIVFVNGCNACAFAICIFINKLDLFEATCSIMHPKDGLAYFARAIGYPHICFTPRSQFYDHHGCRSSVTESITKGSIV